MEMNIDDWMRRFAEIWNFVKTEGWAELVLYMVLGFLLARVVRRVFMRLGRVERLPTQMVRFGSKFLVALVWVLAGVQALRAVGVDLVSVLGAAGVAGVAIGFASQTALSNLISGIFLVTERSFNIGDYVSISGLEGTVETINMLSIYLRQPDNALIRIPCETIIKNPVINFTRDELRRCDFVVGVDYSTNLEQARQVVLDVVAEHPLLAKQPAPVVQFVGYGESSLDLKIGAYCSAKNYHAARYGFAWAIMQAFGKAGISIPFPIRDIRTKGE